MSDTISPPPPDAPVKRARKPRATKPKVEKAPRKKPTTLLARVRAMSPAHLDAYRILSASDGTFRAGLREELDYSRDVARVMARVAAAKSAYEQALVLQVGLEKSKPSGEYRARLDRLAASIGKECEPSDDGERFRAEHPEGAFDAKSLKEAGDNTRGSAS